MGFLTALLSFPFLSDPTSANRAILARNHPKMSLPIPPKEQNQKTPSVSSDQYDCVKQDISYINTPDPQYYLNPTSGSQVQPLSNPGPGLPPPRTFDRAPLPPTRDISISSGTGSDDAFRMSPISPDENKNVFPNSIGKTGSKTKIFRKDMTPPLNEKVLLKQKNSAFDSGKSTKIVCLLG